MLTARRLILVASLLGAARSLAQPSPVAPAPVAAAVAVVAPLPEIPKYRFVINNLTVIRYNALGIEDQIRAGLQLRLYDGEGALKRDNFVFIGLAPKLNPAFIKFGPSIELQPVAAVNLRVAGEVVEFFSTFGFLQSFQSPAALYSDTALRSGQWVEKNYATSGLHFIVEPLIQMQLGPIAVRNRFSAEYWRMSTRASDPTEPVRTDPVFYDATLDTLVPASGWVVADDLDVIWTRRLADGGRFAAGLRYSMVKPLYDSASSLAGEDASAVPDNSHHRLGPVLLWTLYDRGFTRFNKPTVLLISGWYLHHRYRTGTDSSQAIPYVVLGFSFQSDLGSH